MSAEQKTEAVEQAVEKQEVKKEEVAVEAKASALNLDDIKRSGIKDAVVDSDTVAIEKEKEVEPEKVVIPSFFVSETERRKIEIDILSVKETGKIVSVSRAGLAIDFNDFPFLLHGNEWFEFTVPSYEDMSTYRSRCAQWRKEAGQMLVDRLQLRHFFLVWHLRDWSLKDKEGKKIELVFDKDGSMSAESLKVALSMQATILDIVFTAFEKEILLV
jgi:hypothetical protein